MTHLLVIACLILDFVVKLVVPLVMISGKTLSVSSFLIFLIVFQKSCASEALSILDSVFQSGLCASEYRVMACDWISFWISIFSQLSFW